MSDIDILDAQYLVMMVHQLVGGTPLCYAFSLKGNISLLELEKSVQVVVKAHPALKTVFRFKTEKTKEIAVAYQEKEENFVYYRDLSHLSALERNGFLEEKYRQLLNRKVALHEGPFFVFKLYKCAQDEYKFFMGIDHVISDGLSSLQLLHQIFEHLAINKVPFSYSEETYNAVVEKINNYQPSSEGISAFSDFLINLKKDHYVWNPENRKLNYLVPEFQTFSKCIKGEDFRRLVDITKHLRVSLYAIIIAAYLDILFELHPESQKIVLALPTSGRLYPDVDAFSLIGCFAQAMTLSFDKSLMQQPLHNLITLIHNQIHAALEKEIDKIHIQKLSKSLKEDYHILNGQVSVFNKWLFRSSIKSNLYVSFTGYSPIQKKYGSLEIGNYREGSINNAGTCDFMHTIFNNELYLFGNFDLKFFSPGVIESLLEKVKGKLLEIGNTLAFLSFPEIAPPQSSDRHIDYLLKAFAHVSAFKIERQHLLHDLEGQLNLDSLGRIRLITKISKDFKHKINKNHLFNCRTIAELAAALNSFDL